MHRQLRLEAPTQGELATELLRRFGPGVQVRAEKVTEPGRRGRPPRVFFQAEVLGTPKTASTSAVRPARAADLLAGGEDHHEPGHPKRFATEDAGFDQLLKQLSRQSGPRPTPSLLVVGLGTDAEAALSSLAMPHRAGGELGVGGEIGAQAVAYGLGDGSSAERHGTALAGYRAKKVWLAVDPSRKHADTLAWTTLVLRNVEVHGVMAVHTAWTATPDSLAGLGLPVGRPT